MAKKPLNTKQLDSADKYNLQKVADGSIPVRAITLLTVNWQERNGLVVDGKLGPNTQKSLVKQPSTPAAEVEWNYWDGPSVAQPRNRQELYAMLGNPGAGQANKQWHRENIVGAVIPGVPKKLWVHKTVEPYLREAIRRVFIVRPDFRIEKAAAHAFRHMRHDPSRPLSVHSWGAAIDFNPKDNRARSFKRGEGPELWSPAYNRFWVPGPTVVDQAVVDAMASCGFAWGSDWDEDGSAQDHTFYDPMHFEWVARDGNSRLV